jgi:hypothetical protein
VAHRFSAGVITKLCELLRSPNRLVRTAASYGIEAVLKHGINVHATVRLHDDDLAL